MSSGNADGKVHYWAQPRTSSDTMPHGAHYASHRQETDMPRVVRFHQIGGPEVLKIETIDVPPPAAGELRIAVKALGLNRAESMFRSGQYLETPTFPARLGYEAAGSVEAIGPGVR